MKAGAPISSPAAFLALIAPRVDPEPEPVPDTTPEGAGRLPDGSFVFHDGSLIDPEADPERWPPTQADPPRGSNALWCVMYRTMLVEHARRNGPNAALLVAYDAEKAFPEARGMRAWVWDTLKHVGHSDHALGPRPPDPRDQVTVK